MEKDKKVLEGTLVLKQLETAFLKMMKQPKGMKLQLIQLHLAIILNLTDGDIVYNCTGVVINPKNAVKVKIPNKDDKGSKLE